MPSKLTMKPLAIALAVSGLIATPAFAAYGKSTKKHRRAPSYGHRSMSHQSAGASALDKAAQGNSFVSMPSSKSSWQNRLAFGGQVRFNFVNFKDDLDGSSEGKVMQFGSGAAVFTVDGKISDAVSSHMTLSAASGNSYTAAAEANEAKDGTTYGHISNNSPVSEVYVTYQDKGSSVYAKAGQFFLHLGSYADAYASIPCIAQLVTQYSANAVEFGMVQEDSNFNAGVTLFSKNDYLKGDDKVGYGAHASYASKMDDVDMKAGFSLVSDGRDVFRQNAGKSSFATLGLTNEWATVPVATELKAKPLYQISGSAMMQGFNLGVDYTAAAKMIDSNDNSKLQVVGVHGSYKGDVGTGNDMSIHADYETAGKKSGALMNLKNAMRFGVSQAFEGMNVDASYLSGKHIGTTGTEAGKFSGFMLTAKADF